MLFRSRGKGEDTNLRPAEARLEEASGLAAAIDLDVVQSTLVPLAELRPATYMGTGKIEELAALIAEPNDGCLVFSHHHGQNPDLLEV